MANIDGLDQETANKSAFMEMQQQAALGVAHHQAYSNLRNSYAAQNAHEVAFASAGGQPGRPGLGGYPFAAMNNSPLHNTYPHHAGHHPGHHYLTSYPPNVTSCPPCPSPPRDGKYQPLYQQLETVQMVYTHHPSCAKSSTVTHIHTNKLFQFRAKSRYTQIIIKRKNERK